MNIIVAINNPMAIAKGSRKSFPGPRKDKSIINGTKPEHPIITNISDSLNVFLRLSYTELYIFYLY